MILFFSILLVKLTITRHTALVKFQRRKSRTVFKWFEQFLNGYSDMKANPDKCHMLVDENGSFVAYLVKAKFLTLQFLILKLRNSWGSLWIIYKLSIITFLSHAKQSLTNFMHSLELHLTWINIRKKHRLIYPPQFNYRHLIWVKDTRSLNNKLTNYMKEP